MRDPSTAGETLRRGLVRELEREGHLRSAAVRAAFLAVPRELFLPEFVGREGLEAVYRDEAIPTKYDARGLPISSSSQPAIMAEMLEQLELGLGMRVLEVGAGTGYNAALLSTIVGPSGQVTTIDVDAEVARAARAALRKGGYPVRVVVGDGRDGFAERAPYDRIVVTASSETVRQTWFDQLSEGGLVELPLRVTRTAQVIPALRKRPGRLVTTSVVAGSFMPLRATTDSESSEGPLPSLIASDATTARPARPLGQISGQSLSSLPRNAKRRLLAVTLSEARQIPLGLRADPGPLAFYLALTLPRTRSINIFPGWTVGLISRDGASIAYVESQARRGRRGIRSLTAHGGPQAQNELLDAIKIWDSRGRPGTADLEIIVDYPEGEPRLRRSWRKPGARRR